MNVSLMEQEKIGVLLSQEQFAIRDSLTGLDRYEIFLRKLQKAIDNMGDRRVVIVYTDIKYFKYINDTYGY